MHYCNNQAVDILPDRFLTIDSERGANTGQESTNGFGTGLSEKLPEGVINLIEVAISIGSIGILGEFGLSLIELDRVVR